MKFYVYGDLENEIAELEQQGASKQEIKSKVIFLADFNYCNMYTSGQLKLINRKNYIYLFSGNAPVKTYYELNNLCLQKQLKAEGVPFEFSYFIPVITDTLLKNEFTMYKKLIKAENKRDFIDQIRSNKLHSAIVEYCSEDYFLPYATPRFSSIGEELEKYFENAVSYLRTIDVNKIVAMPNKQVLINDIKSMYYRYLPKKK